MIEHDLEPFKGIGSASLVHIHGSPTLYISTAS